MTQINRCFLIVIMSCIALSVSAKISLPAYFSDNMIIQQKSSLVFPGKAEANKNVVVETGWDGKKYTTKSDPNGIWSVAVSTPEAGGPYTISISDGEVFKLTNVLVGEVWLCSGQSNMEMPLAGWGKVLNYEQEIANADYPSIRLLQVKKTTSVVPLDEVQVNMEGWQECTPQSVKEFSSVAYFYARKLWDELKVPVGVIDCTWGGTPAEAWTSFNTLQHVSGYQESVSMLKEAGFDKQTLLSNYQQKIDKHNRDLIGKDKGYVDGRPIWVSKLQQVSDWKEMTLPGNWEAKGLKDFDGIVWFQKEIDIPASWEGKPIALSLGMIDDEDITYYNGVEIAKGAGYQTPRNYTIPAALVKKGKGVITVRVADYAGEGGITGNLSAKSGNEIIALSGSWNYQVGMSLKDLTPMPLSPESSGYPTVLYNGMVNPLIKFPIKGAIWYQGESNAERADRYARLFQSMITDWREKWGYEFPFYFVQLANFMAHQEVQPDSKWAALREAQSEALHLKNTGMAVAIDIGEAGDIHPKNKQEVGRRLALLSLSDTYKKNVESRAAYMTDYYVSGGALVLLFNETLPVSSAVKGFIVAGADNVYYPAVATIDGNKIILKSASVKTPLAARYGWADNPECTLKSKSGLPVAPFRTDK